MVYTRPYWIVIISSVSAVLAFVAPRLSAEFIFVFLVPLMWFSQKWKYRFSILQGALWGFIFNTLFFLDIYLYIMHYGHGWARYLVIVIVLLYNSFLAGCWFLLTSVISQILRCTYSHLISWSLASVVFFLFNDYCYFLPFGEFCGNVFVHVSVPLAVRALWIFLLQLFGKQIFLFFVIGTNGFLAYFIIYKKYRYLFYSFLALTAIFTVFQYFCTPEPAKEWFRNFGCVCIVPSQDDPPIVAERIMHALDLFEKQYGEINYIVMPESTFSFPLNSFKKYCSLWQLCPEKKIFLGSHRFYNSRLFNTLYYIENGAIIDFYDKQHTMLFTEYVPSLWSMFGAAQSLFLYDKVPFGRGVIHVPFSIASLGKVYPLICSDLFMGGSKLACNQYYLCCVNDSWFCHTYSSNLMFLYAKTIAALKHSYIIYCAYRHTGIISPRGDAYRIPTINI